MRRLFIVYSFILFTTYSISAQNASKKTYDWKEIIDLQENNHIRQANEIVNKYFERALKEKNTSETIKALLFQSKYALTLEQDATFNIISNFKKTIDQSSFPTKNILQSTLAQIYWNLLQSERWELYERTKVEDQSINLEDSKTWDAHTYLKQIDILFTESLKNKDKAQKIFITEFKDILITENDSDVFRPTLYDFLIHNAINFYKSSEIETIQGIGKFVIDTPEYFNDIHLFTEISLPENSYLNPVVKTLSLYQEILKYHLLSGYKNALAQANLERLEYVYRTTQYYQRENDYINSLENFYNNNKYEYTNTLIAFKLAKEYENIGLDYNPKSPDKERHWALKKAIDICREAIDNREQSAYRENCIALIDNLEQPILNIDIQEYMLPKQEQLALITYKQTENVAFSIYKVYSSQVKELDSITTQDQIKEFFASLKKPTKQWIEVLKNFQDYQEHQTEIAIPRLRKGTYIIAASNYDNNTGVPQAYSYFQVTDLTFLESQIFNNYQFQILNRKDGFPVKNATIHLQNHTEDTTDNATLNIKLKTNKFGEASYKQTKDSYDVIAKVFHDQDTAVFETQIYKVGKSKELKELKNQTKAYFYTDRSIYKPGQIVYYKGIILKNDQLDVSVVDKKDIRVQILDSQGNQLQDLIQTTNEYGSVSGVFHIPEDVLTGDFYFNVQNLDESVISISESSRKDFSVENYKAPSFEVKFKTNTNTYLPGDYVKIEGTATSYAQSPITNATVTYKINRTIQFPYISNYSHIAFPIKQQEIASGKTTTDGKGNFLIEFQALNENNIPKKSLPVYDYTIIADVQDINGESQGNSTDIKISSENIVANIDIPKQINNQDKDLTFKVTARNLNNRIVNSEVKVLIYEIKKNSIPFRKRPWPSPDVQNFTKEEFYKLFPNTPFDRENELEFRPLDKKVFEKKIITSRDKTITLPDISKWATGDYAVILEIKNKEGRIIKNKQYFDLYNKNQKNVDSNILFSHQFEGDFIQGEKAKLKLGTGLNSFFLTMVVEKNGEIVDKKYISLKNNYKTINIPITGNYDFDIHLYWVHFNSFESFSNKINVQPRTGLKELDIHTKTFRDRLTPGEKENWTFEIKNPKSKYVFAEVLASMYDASLDIFKPNDWSFKPNFKEYTPDYFLVNADMSFNQKQLELIQQIYYPYNELKFDRLNWFGFELKNFRILYKKTKLGLSFNQEDDEFNEFEDDDPIVEIDEVELDLNNQGENARIEGVGIRKNFSETAFFYPNLKTNTDNEIEFSFDVVDNLTQWKLQLLAHTKMGNHGIKKYTLFSEKKFMVQPNAPRYFRQGDELVFQAKISNVTRYHLDGEAQLELFDSQTGEKLESAITSQESIPFKVKHTQNTSVEWNIRVPENVSSITYKIVAKTPSFTDGEQRIVPVLTNKILVTQTQPIWARPNEDKTFNFKSLQEQSSDRENHLLTLELTSNPIWYAIESISGVLQPKDQSNQSIFNSLYTNSIASYLVEQNPKIKDVFEKWKNSDSLISQLDTNENLKQIILNETPWVKDAKSEKEQKERLANLFESQKLKNTQILLTNQLETLQLENGGFPWFKAGVKSNKNISLWIATNIAKLDHMGVPVSKELQDIFEKVKNYLDIQVSQEYIKTTLGKNFKPDQYNLDEFTIAWLYLNSFNLANIKSLNSEADDALKFYTNQAQKFWSEEELASQARIALYLYRTKQHLETVSTIVSSFEQRSIVSDELGMYFKQNKPSYYWFENPLSTQCLIIESFFETKGNSTIVEQLKQWLLKQKQTHQWETDIATTDAIYTLLQTGEKWQEKENEVNILVGDKSIENKQIKEESAGIGHQEYIWNKDDINPSLGVIDVDNKGSQPIWGGMYWQYFQSIDKVKSSIEENQPLSVKKEVFIKRANSKGFELIPVRPQTRLKLGELLTVRLIISTDRDMEFVHLKDNRASAFEPVDVISTYQWKEGLSFYKNTTDNATNFYFDQLYIGTYVFEYDVKINNSGVFIDGISTIQSMYAPSFSAHTQGRTFTITK